MRRPTELLLMELKEELFPPQLAEAGFEMCWL